jgi:hypothetical protein
MSAMLSLSTNKIARVNLQGESERRGGRGEGVDRLVDPFPREGEDVVPDMEEILDRELVE